MCQILKTYTAVFTNQGGRNNNEDYAGYTLTADGEKGVWLVADGLGGHRNGEVASRMAVETMIEMFSLNPDVDESNITALFKTANERILQQSPEYSGMKTTLTALFIENNQALWAHAGDTRLYYFSAGRLSAQTKDHSVSQIAVDVGEISPDQIRHHADRSKLLRALGDNPDVMPAITPAPAQLQAGDAFLLCTDGFWEYVYETEMEIDLSKSLSPDAWLRLMAIRRAERAPEDSDNFTALAVFIS